jgi:hypothetical protein
MSKVGAAGRDIYLRELPPDRLAVTEMRCSRDMAQSVVARFGAESVLVLALPGKRPRDLRRDA